LRTYCILPEAVGVTTGATATSDCIISSAEYGLALARSRCMRAPSMSCIL
jgi:hypothetical protein